MAKEDERSWNELLEFPIEKLNKRSRSFKISLDAQRYRSYLTVTLLKGNEWEDLCNEVWPRPNPRIPEDQRTGNEAAFLGERTRLTR